MMPPLSFYGGTTYTWDGSSFTTKPASHNANNPGFPSSAGAGVTSDAGLRLDNGGKTECYNGSTWSEVNAMASDSTTQYGMSGTSTDALKAGGYSGGVQIWGGTNWSEGASLANSTVYGRYQGSSNIGLYSAGNELPAGGYGQEEWNGTSWSEQNNLPTAKGASANTGGALGDAAIFAGGFAPGAVNTVEFWNAGLSATGSFGRINVDSISGDASQTTGLEQVFTKWNNQ